jgi:hypothetical protein
MIPTIDFDDLDTKSEWHGALNTIVAAARKHASTDGGALQTLLVTYVGKCPFPEYCEIAQQVNRGLGKAVVSAAIEGIASRNDDLTAATDEIDDVTATATKQASGLLMKGPLDALAKAQQALDAIKPSTAKAATE